MNVKTTWSYYGHTEPKGLLASAWIAAALHCPVVFVALRFEFGAPEEIYGKLIWFGYSAIAGILILTAAVKLKSWLLCILFVVIAFSYPIVNFMATGGRGLLAA